MTGIRSSGKSQISTHTFCRKLTPTTDLSTNVKVTTCKIEDSIHPASQSSERRADTVGAPMVKDGEAFPLIAGVDVAEALRKQSEQQKGANCRIPRIDISNPAAFPSLGGSKSAAKPAAQTPPQWTNETVRVTARRQQKRVPALNRSLYTTGLYRV